jgi:predicted ABC-type transport system involved in lysophospholipase L1 biosynthesis ATPase subunit
VAGVLRLAGSFGLGSQMVESAVSARGIRMRGPWGPVYGPVDLDIAEGGVTVLICPPGSGRTALLMTLAGRMRPVEGTLTVFGTTRAREAFAVSALAGIDDIDTVPESVTVRDLLTEQLRWNASWYKLIRRADEADLKRVCEPVFGDLPLPRLDAFVDQLTELEEILLRIALANTTGPRLLVVGSLDAVAVDGDRALLLNRLIELGAAQTVVTSAANPLVGAPACTQVPIANTEPANTEPANTEPANTEPAEATGLAGPQKGAQ